MGSAGYDKGDPTMGPMNFFSLHVSKYVSIVPQAPGLCLIFFRKEEGPPPPRTPPPKTKVTIVGKNEICNRENLVGRFLVHKLLGPRPPLPPPPSC